ncbi:MAG: penicillin acylase family protein [Candidatus Kapabacteria bacterium]|nr:penicillin acylase family protein [Candidatus Kapabacteria bacterium]
MFKLRRFLILLLSLAVIFAAFFFFAVKLAYVSLPDDFIEEKVEKIKDTIKVYSNQYGIPHIIAKNESDAFFMMGYQHALDRLWQMELYRRTSQGSLAEILGPDLLDIDRFYRSLQIEKIAKKIWKFMDKDTRMMLQSYSDGVNYFVEENKHKLPLEFNALSFVPRKWEPFHSIMIQRLLAFEQSIAFSMDITMSQIALKLGMKEALELIPKYEVLKNKDTIKSSQNPQTKHITYHLLNNNKLNDDLANTLSEISKTIRKKDEFLNKDFNSNGSNTWVTRKIDSINNNLILANDPHLKLGLPSYWYQIHISCPSFNVTGMSIPGMPLVLVGRNDYISWGMTASMVDDCDFFIEKIDSADNDFYYFNGAKKAFNYIKDTIKINGEEALKYYLRETERSAVISDAHIKLEPKEKFWNNCVTFSWTGQFPSNEFKAMYLVNKARNKTEFENALSLWAVPGLIFSYADKQGNLGLKSAVKLPVRNSTNPIFINEGWQTGKSWSSELSNETVPGIYNPLSKYVVAANNKMNFSYNFHFSDYYALNKRAERISDILNQHKEYYARDAQIMQLDLLSLYAKEFLEMTLPYLERNYKFLNETEKEALNKLKKWDLILSPISTSSSIYTKLFERVIYNTFSDELRDNLYNDYTSFSSYPAGKFLELMRATDSTLHWFDDKRTKPVENKEQIVMISYSEAIEALKTFYNSDNPNLWQYGENHQLVLKHFLSRNVLLKPTLEVGPFKLGGDFSTINVNHGSISNPKDISLGASMRFITDMEEPYVYFIIPGGSSGDPVSPNFVNQVQLWINGGYIKIGTDSKPDKDFNLKILFKPR